jgi:hypothetical protein
MDVSRVHATSGDGTRTAREAASAPAREWGSPNPVSAAGQVTRAARPRSGRPLPRSRPAGREGGASAAARGGTERDRRWPTRGGPAGAPTGSMLALAWMFPRVRFTPCTYHEWWIRVIHVACVRTARGGRSRIARTSVPRSSRARPACGQDRERVVARGPLPTRGHRSPLSPRPPPRLVPEERERGKRGNRRRRRLGALPARRGIAASAARVEYTAARDEGWT